MGWIILIITGAIIGWLANLVVASEKPHGLIVDILIGIIGSLLGKWLFFDVLGIGGALTAGTLSLAGVLWGVLGAIVLIAILKILRVY